MAYEIEEYVTPDGNSPFAEWFDGLRDKTARTKLTARIDRAAHGNLGDWKAVAGSKGLYEMREHYGPGYRVYFSIVERKLILLLAGSNKRDQNRTITKAKNYLAHFERTTMS